MAWNGETKHSNIDRDAVMSELEEKGFVVIPDVCSAHDCDVYTSQYRDWLLPFKGERPSGPKSVVMGYNTGHLKTTWLARLQAKPVFATIWKTEKLLTSIDRIAISYPPEKEDPDGFNVGTHWFHVDHNSLRIGLHGYQGGLYLEETTENDHCFRVLSGSHKLKDAFFEEFEEAAEESLKKGYHIKEKELAWFRQKGCVPTKVSVPKGGMVLWDTRTFHDNCKPERGRPNSDRWRFVVFVCMMPARWARPEDMEVRKYVYQNAKMAGHWASQGINILEDITPEHSYKIHIPDQLPEVACTKEVRLLTGDLEYDFEDGEPNGPDWMPRWKKPVTE